MSRSARGDILQEQGSHSFNLRKSPHGAVVKFGSNSLPEMPWNAASSHYYDLWTPTMFPSERMLFVTRQPAEAPSRQTGAAPVPHSALRRKYSQVHTAALTPQFGLFTG